MNIELARGFCPPLEDEQALVRPREAGKPSED